MTNALLVVIIVLLLAMLVLQVWQMVDDNRPVMRPGLKPAPKLPDAWYEKYKDQEASTERTTRSDIL